MERANPFVLFAGLLAMFALWGGTSLLQDGLYIAKHEGDAVHLLDILLRMAAGQVPHLDFMTPIGSMSFKPIVWIMGPETGAGRAIILSQVLVLAALMPAVFWVGLTRLTSVQALLFGLIITILVTAFVHGTAEPTISVSMHYNRWAWAVAFLALTLAVLPARDLRLPVLDGAIIGGSLALLVLIKVTYVVAFAPPVLVALVARREWTSLVAAIVTGLVLLGGYTISTGIEYWLVYVQDILLVANSDIRPNPSHPISGVIAAPEFIGGSLVLLASVIFLRQSKEQIGGLVLMLLVPGFFFVAYQNFSNDPQWLYLLPVLLFAMRPAAGIRNGLGWDMRRAITFAGVIAMALTAPSFFNLAYSPFRHAVVDSEGYAPLLREDPVNSDFLVPNDRIFAAEFTVGMLGEGAPYASYSEMLDDVEPPLEVLDYTFPQCQLHTGYVAYFETVAKSLEAAGYAGANVMQADIFSTVHWLYANFPPLKRGAPWSYGTDDGLVEADYLLVALCPLSDHWRRVIVDAVRAHEEISLTEAHRNELFVLYRISKP